MPPLDQVPPGAVRLLSTLAPLLAVALSLLRRYYYVDYYVDFTRYFTTYFTTYITT